MYPVVTITGPRQSGKTTLAKSCFQGLPYINLEHLEEREFSRDDPVGFFKRMPDGKFVLTGSIQLNVMESVSESLAGRTVIVKLLPFSVTGWLEE